ASLLGPHRPQRSGRSRGAGRPRARARDAGADRRRGRGPGLPVSVRRPLAAHAGAARGTRLPLRLESDGGRLPAVPAADRRSRVAAGAARARTRGARLGAAALLRARRLAALPVCLLPVPARPGAAEHGVADLAGRVRLDAPARGRRCADARDAPAGDRALAPDGDAGALRRALPRGRREVRTHGGCGARPRGGGMKIAVLDDYQHVAEGFADWSRLGDHELTFFDEHLGDDPAQQLASFDVVCAMRERTRFSAEAFDRLPNLKLLVTTGMRNASIDMEAAAAHGVTVCGTEVPSTPTAELAWGLVLALVRHISVEDQGMREGGWMTTVGVDLNGKTLGILGLGRLGSIVARYGAALGMRLIAWSENLTAERAAGGGAERVTKDEPFST